MHLQYIYKVKINHFRFRNLRQLLVLFNDKRISFTSEN